MMNRAQLEHVIRAAGAVCGEDELVVIGSQAILAGIDAPPPELVQSMEEMASEHRPVLLERIGRLRG